MDSSNYYYRGIEKNKSGDFQGAIKDYSKAISIDSSFIDAYRRRGKNNFFLGDINGALVDYAKAIEIYPKNSYSYSTYYDRGLLKLELNEYQGAIDDFTESIKNEPDSDWNSYAKRGLAKYHLKNYISAIDDCNKAIEIAKHWGYPYYIRGIIKIKIKKTESGCKDLHKAIEENTYDGQNCRDSIQKYCK